MAVNFSLFQGRNFRRDDQSVDSRIDRLTYAVGDIHGRRDLLHKMLDTINTDAEKLNEKPRIVLLGDYIDRGPNSSGVLASLAELTRQKWCDLVILLGNHEYFLVNFFMNSQSGKDWLEFGGLEFLRSYGLRPPRDRNSAIEWKALLEDLIRVVPKEHLRVLYKATVYFIAGDYLFVHAGVKPGVAIENMGPETMLWIREEFLAAEWPSEYVVVHGHSAKQEPENLPWRIGVDTGAYATNVLTAVRLIGNSRDIIQVSMDDDAGRAGPFQRGPGR